MADLTPRRRRYASGMRPRGGVPTASPPPRTARSTTLPSPATTSPASIRKPAGQRSSSRRRRNKARGGSGRTSQGGSGSASGLPARSVFMTQRTRVGARGACLGSGRRRTLFMSMRRTGSGSATSAPMPSSFSNPRRSTSRRSRATVPMRMFARFSAVRARYGRRNRQPIELVVYHTGS